MNTATNPVKTYTFKWWYRGAQGQWCAGEVRTKRMHAKRALAYLDGLDVALGWRVEVSHRGQLLGSRTA